MKLLTDEYLTHFDLRMTEIEAENLIAIQAMITENQNEAAAYI